MSVVTGTAARTSSVQASADAPITNSSQSSTSPSDTNRRTTGSRLERVVPWCAAGLRQTIQTPIAVSTSSRSCRSTSLPSSAMPSDRSVCIVCQPMAATPTSHATHLCQYHAVSVQTFTRRSRSALGARKKRINVLPSRIARKASRYPRMIEPVNGGHANSRNVPMLPAAETAIIRMANVNRSHNTERRWRGVSSVSTPKCARHGRARRRNRNCAAMPPARNTLRNPTSRSRSEPGNITCVWSRTRARWVGMCPSSAPMSHSRERIRVSVVSIISPAVAVALLGRGGGSVPGSCRIAWRTRGSPSRSRIAAPRSVASRSRS